MDVTAPGTLTAAALADAAGATGATVVFASPAALRNVVATAGSLAAGQRAALARVRLVMSAGAPVPGRPAPPGRRGAARGRAAHAVRDDRGAAGHRHLAAGDRGRRSGRRRLRRSTAAWGRGPAQPAGRARPGRGRADHRARGDRRDLCRRRARQAALRPAVGAGAGQHAQPGLAPHRRRRPPRPRGPAVGRGSAGARGHQRGRAGHAGRGRAGRRGPTGGRPGGRGRGRSGGDARPWWPSSSRPRRGHLVRWPMPRWRRPSATPRRSRWPPCSPRAGCPSTSATTPRSTAPPLPAGRTGCWPATRPGRL